MLRDAETHWGVNPIPTPLGLQSIRSQADVYRLIYAVIAEKRGVTLAAADARDTDVDPLPVQVNHNRFVVVCPDCGGAEFAWPDDPWFLCAGCFNATLGGKWRPVIWPGDDELAEVESVLSARPLPAERNWNPETEDVDALKRQNREKGQPEKVAEWDEAERPKRVKGHRNAATKDGREWRRILRKRRQLAPREAPRLFLPEGWDTPTSIALPPGTHESSELLYPDVPTPPDVSLGRKPGE